MRNESLGDVWKVWLYAAASVWLGAWMSPLLYNAGKALAEISQSKTTNGPLEWLAGICRTADFPRFYGAGLLLAALVLFFPWMEWIHARRGVAVAGGGPWRLRLPDGARVAGRGQWLEKNPRGWWHLCAGFLLVAGLLLAAGLALVPAGMFTLRNTGAGLVPLVLKSLVAAFALALVMEVFFRGIVMGIFLRAMRPAAALGMSAAFFALVLAVFPAAGVNVADPEAARPGFELLRLLVARFAELGTVLGSFMPLLALGAVLAYARWRTASLWLPVGLHAGWWFAKSLLAALSTAGPVISVNLVALAAILIAGALARFLIASPAIEDAPRS
ncbi:MAG: CPBP family intramembrane metalloprotease [Verrucomicrobiaceae bacterium]|nr:MAG: CPBP family intramembrane metalloprotease [Verrucomicrobiaceae bacterium]